MYKFLKRDPAVNDVVMINLTQTLGLVTGASKYQCTVVYHLGNGAVSRVVRHDNVTVVASRLLGDNEKDVHIMSLDVCGSSRHMGEVFKNVNTCGGTLYYKHHVTSRTLREFRVLIQESEQEDEDNPYKPKKVLQHKPKSTNFRAFYKKSGKLNVVGLFKQYEKFGLTDTRPFILKAMKEYANATIPTSVNTAIEDCKKSWNLLALGNFLAIDEGNDVIVGLKYKSAPIPNTLVLDMTVNFINAKEALVGDVNHSWIKGYLTVANLNADKVTLYQDKKIEIFIEDGHLVYKGKQEFKFPILLDVKKNEFYI